MKMVRSKMFLSILVLLAALLTGCISETLDGPAYPLAGETVEQALAGVGLHWSAVAEDFGWEGNTVCSLYDAEDHMMGVISSTEKEGHRLMIFQFMPHGAGHLTPPLPEEQWKSAFEAAALLYGGFINQQTLYDAFAARFDEEKTPIEQIEKPGARHVYEERYEWQDWIDGVYCIVRTGKPYSFMPDEYLSGITLVDTEEDIFGSWI